MRPNDEAANPWVFSIASGCSNCESEIDKLMGEDGVGSETQHLTNASVLATHGCDERNAICLSPSGAHLNPENTQNRFRPGDKVRVLVIGCKAVQDKVKFSQEVEHISSGDQLFRDPDEATQAKRNAAKNTEKIRGTCSRDRLCTSSSDIVVLHEKVVTIPKDDALQRLEVIFASDPAEATYKESLKPNGATHDFPVVQGRYFVDLGVLVPFTIEGDRNVVGEELPGSGAQRLAVRQDTLMPAPAIMLNVFPGGRRLGIFQSFAEHTRCASPGRRKCRQRNHRRNAANSLGVQLGLDLDFTDAADRFYLGGLFEPVSGLSFNAGLAIVKGEFLREGRSEGQLIARDADVDPKVWPIARPYFGITLSLDIVRTIIAYTSRVQESYPEKN